MSLGAGATENLACVKWPNGHAAILERFGAPIATPYPARAGFKFRDVRVAEVRFAAGFPVEIAGGRGKFTTRLLDAGTSALPRKGALESLGGQPDFSRNCLQMSKLGAGVPL